LCCSSFTKAVFIYSLILSPSAFCPGSFYLLTFTLSAPSPSIHLSIYLQTTFFTYTNLILKSELSTFLRVSAALEFSTVDTYQQMSAAFFFNYHRRQHADEIFPDDRKEIMFSPLLVPVFFFFFFFLFPFFLCLSPILVCSCRGSATYLTHLKFIGTRRLRNEASFSSIFFNFSVTRIFNSAQKFSYMDD
jgi:hypothetical protein